MISILAREFKNSRIIPKLKICEIKVTQKFLNLQLFSEQDKTFRFLVLVQNLEVWQCCMMLDSKSHVTFGSYYLESVRPVPGNSFGGKPPFPGTAHHYTS